MSHTACLLKRVVSEKLVAAGLKISDALNAPKNKKRLMHQIRRTSSFGRPDVYSLDLKVLSRKGDTAILLFLLGPIFAIPFSISLAVGLSAENFVPSSVCSFLT